MVEGGVLRVSKVYFVSVILKHKSRIRERGEESRVTEVACYLGYPGRSKRETSWIG